LLLPFVSIIDKVISKSSKTFPLTVSVPTFVILTLYQSTPSILSAFPARSPVISLSLKDISCASVYLLFVSLSYIPQEKRDEKE
jgi:hypothetical protein